MKLSTSTFPFSRTVCGYTAEDPGDAGHHRLSCTACRSPFGVADLVTFETVGQVGAETGRRATAHGTVRAVSEQIASCVGTPMWWLTVEVHHDAGSLRAGDVVTVASGQAAAL